MQSVVHGVIIRAKTVGENRLLTILSRESGVISVTAKGAGKPRASLTSSTELFCYSRLTIFRYRDFNTVDSAETLQSFFSLRSDLTALALASYIAELCCELAPAEQEAEEYLRLLLNTLHFICEKKKSVWFLKALFELRLVSMAGFMPDLTACCECGGFESAGMRFSIEDGSLICNNCKERAGGAISLSPAVLAAMRHIIYSQFEKLFSFSLSDSAERELCRVIERYLKYHLQREYRSLDFFYSVAE